MHTLNKLLVPEIICHLYQSLMAQAVIIILLSSNYSVK